MKFNPHSELRDRHALLAPSRPYWLNDDPEEFLIRVQNSRAAALGTRKHNLAKELIEIGQGLPNTSQTLNLYVNDCIGFQMACEQPLFYSWNAFGSADAIQLRKEEEDVFVLRIFDLKTGVTLGNPLQLKLYAALFCLEYEVKPMMLDFDLRFYQNDDITFIETDGEEIAYIMDRIVTLDKLITDYQEEGLA